MNRASDSAALRTPEIAPYVTIAHAWLSRWIGIDIQRGGVARSIDRHIVSRLIALGSPSPVRFAEMLEQAATGEGRKLIEASTIPHSWLFRDDGPLRSLLARFSGRSQPVNVWVAGCAKGEEAYTVAALGLLAGLDIRVLATDVNEGALARARMGTFDPWTAREVPRVARGFLHEGAGGGVTASNALRQRITFEMHSLMTTPRTAPGGGNWDAIVCRNVLIYFAPTVALAIVRRLSMALIQGGALVIGASDVLADLPPGLVASPEAGRVILARETSERSPQTEPTAKPTAATARLAPIRTPFEFTSELPRPLPSPLPQASQAAPASLAALAAVRALPSTAGEILEALDRGQLDIAFTSAAAWRERDPLDPEPPLLCGMALHARGAWEDAVSHLRASVCLAPGAWVAWFYLALSWERLGAWDDAKRAYRQISVARGPGDDLPRGASDVATALRFSRASVEQLARRREFVLEHGPDSTEKAP